MDLVYACDAYGRSGWKDAMLSLTMVSLSSAFLGFVVSSDSPLSLSCSGSGNGVRSSILLDLLTEPCPLLVDETSHANKITTQRPEEVIPGAKER